MTTSQNNDPEAGTVPDITAQVGDAGTSGGEVERDPRDIELEDLREKHRIALAQKEALEAANRRNAELEAQLNQSNRPALESSADAANMEALQQSIAEVSLMAANSSDPRQSLARVQLANLKLVEQQLLAQEAERQRVARMQWDQEQLRKVPAEWRDKTIEFYQANRNRFGDPEAAFMALKGTLPPEKDKGDDTARQRRESSPATSITQSETMPRSNSNEGGGILRMKRSEYYERARSGDAALIASKDAGRIVLID